MNNEFGDFQTPLALARQIWDLLQKKGDWDYILEPTCGEGNFIDAVVNETSPIKVFGIETQARYVEKLSERYREKESVTIIHKSLFDVHLAKDLNISNDKSLLVIGNPPWVTNAQLGALDSLNLPQKANFKNLRGLDALTGASNFDICEYIWLKLIYELANFNPTIALLCKTAVARNIIRHCFKNGLPVRESLLFKIDAKKWFGINADACLYVLALGESKFDGQTSVFVSLDAQTPEKLIQFEHNHLVSCAVDYQKVNFVEGKTNYVWRQGIKHDAGSVVEIIRREGEFYNKLNEKVIVEPEYLFPLLKGSDIYNKGQERLRPERWLIVPQNFIKEDTAFLAQKAPLLWDYLNKNETFFTKRKSSIYQNAPRFSYFGLGAYSFAPYKICIAGMYKEPAFQFISPISEKPVMLDDTCYFLPFTDKNEAEEVYRALTSESVRNFIRAIIFQDAKRPITKAVLQRIAIEKLLNRSPALTPTLF